MKLKYIVQLLSFYLTVMTTVLNVQSSDKQTESWAKMIRETRGTSVIFERKVFDKAGEKPRDVKKHQIRIQSGAIFFRLLDNYADATNYTTSRTVASGRWENMRWAVQANDLYLTTETNHDSNGTLWLFDDLAQDLTEEVICWGIRKVNRATFEPTGSNGFQAKFMQTGWEMAGEVLSFSEEGLPTKLLYVSRGPSGPYRTNLVEYDFDTQAKIPCLPKEIRSFLLTGDRQIPHIFHHIEEYKFADLPKEAFLPVVFSGAKPFRAELVTTDKGVFQRKGEELVKVGVSASAMPVRNSLRFLYFVLVLVLGGTLVLVFRHSKATKLKR